MGVKFLVGGDTELEVAQISPWMDRRVPANMFKIQLVAAQTHGRFFKTYLPVDALCFYDKAKYIYIGKDVRDVIWSLLTTMLTPLV